MAKLCQHHLPDCRYFGGKTLGLLAVSSPHPLLVRRFFVSGFAGIAKDFCVAKLGNGSPGDFFCLFGYSFFLDSGLS